jgi:hypothetical protein
VTSLAALSAIPQAGSRPINGYSETLFASWTAIPIKCCLSVGLFYFTFFLFFPDEMTSKIQNDFILMVYSISVLYCKFLEFYLPLKIAGLKCIITYFRRCHWLVFRQTLLSDEALDLTWML